MNNEKRPAFDPFPLSFAQLRRTNVARCNSAFHPGGSLNEWTPTDWSTALGGECGEVLNEVKKLRRLGAVLEDIPDFPEKSMYINRIADELADLVTYADLLAARLGIDLGEAVASKFNRVSDRMDCEIKLPLTT